MVTPVQMNRGYLAGLIADSTVEAIHYDAGDLLIFADDTGDEKRSEGQPVFGLGGCALLGAAYDALKPAWADLRREAFQLSDDAQFHTTDLLPSLSAGQLSLVTDFLGSPKFRKYANIVTRQSAIHDEVGELDAVIKGVSSAVDLLFLDETVQRAHWIIEHSDRLCRAMITTGQSPNYHRCSQTVSFMKKQAREPGLEISDLIIFIVGKHYRDELSGKRTYYDQMTAMFSDRLTGVWDHTLSAGPPMWIDTRTGEHGIGSSMAPGRVSGPPRKGAGRPKKSKRT